MACLDRAKETAQESWYRGVLKDKSLGHPYVASVCALFVGKVIVFSLKKWLEVGCKYNFFKKSGLEIC